MSARILVMGERCNDGDHLLCPGGDQGYECSCRCHKSRKEAIR